MRACFFATLAAQRCMFGKKNFMANQTPLRVGIKNHHVVTPTMCHVVTPCVHPKLSITTIHVVTPTHRRHVVTPTYLFSTTASPAPTHHRASWQLECPSCDICLHCRPIPSIWSATKPNHIPHMCGSCKQLYMASFAPPIVYPILNSCSYDLPALSRK